MQKYSLSKLTPGTLTENCGGELIKIKDLPCDINTLIDIRSTAIDYITKFHKYINTSKNDDFKQARKTRFELERLLNIEPPKNS